MNKILIALVLAVVMSGNAYAFRLSPNISYSECMKAIEKGKLIANQDFDEYNTFNYYFYKEKVYRVHFSLPNKTMVCDFFDKPNY